MDQESIDLHDELKLVAMRVGNLEQRLRRHRDLVAALVLVVGALTLVLMAGG